MHTDPTTTTVPALGELVIPARHRGVADVVVDRRNDGLVTVEYAKNFELAPLGTIARDVETRVELMNTTLADGATVHSVLGTRPRAEDPDPHRSCFERDRDRIVHASAFRRLAGKCQVFIAPANDMLRNRLTHAIEVAQVAVSIARAVGLNEALCEAAALGHDCGHGPAGHASEDAFTPYLAGGYDHAIYGAEVVLAELNLCAETTDAIRNHSWRLPPAHSHEGMLVAVADRVAYVCHDFEDAKRAGIVVDSMLPPEVTDVLGVEHSDQLGRLVQAVIDGIARTGQVCIPEPYATALAAFRSFNYDYIYLRPASARNAEKVIQLLQGLVEFFIDAPGAIPDVATGTVAHPGSGTAEAAVEAVRYVSGMTDRFALGLGVELLGWRSENLPRGV